MAVCFKGEVVEQHISGDMQQISASQFLRDASGGGGGGSLLRLLRERLAMEKRGVQKLEQRASRQKKPVTFLVSESSNWWRQLRQLPLKEKSLILFTTMQALLFTLHAAASFYVVPRILDADPAADAARYVDPTLAHRSAYVGSVCLLLATMCAIDVKRALGDRGRDAAGDGGAHHRGGVGAPVDRLRVHGGRHPARGLPGMLPGVPRLPHLPDPERWRWRLLAAGALAGEGDPADRPGAALPLPPPPRLLRPPRVWLAHVLVRRRRPDPAQRPPRVDEESHAARVAAGRRRRPPPRPRAHLAANPRRAARDLLIPFFLVLAVDGAWLGLTFLSFGSRRHFLILLKWLPTHAALGRPPESAPDEDEIFCEAVWGPAVFTLLLLLGLLLPAAAAYGASSVAMEAVAFVADGMPAFVLFSFAIVLLRLAALLSLAFVWQFRSPLHEYFTKGAAPRGLHHLPAFVQRHVRRDVDEERSASAASE